MSCHIKFEKNFKIFVVLKRCAYLFSEDDKTIGATVLTHSTTIFQNEFWSPLILNQYSSPLCNKHNTY